MNPRHLRSVTAAALIALAASALRGAAPAGPVDFVAHDIDANFRGGYSVSVADFNNDGKIDVIANSLQVQELGWYENPTWERHVIVTETQQIVNEAMADIDGDGIPEIAFQSSFAMQAGASMGQITAPANAIILCVLPPPLPEPLTNMNPPGLNTSDKNFMLWGGFAKLRAVLPEIDWSKYP